MVDNDIQAIADYLTLAGREAVDALYEALAELHTLLEDADGSP